MTPGRWNREFLNFKHLNRLFRLIPDRFRRKGLAVALMVPLTALLDMFGVALLFSMVFMVLDGGETFDQSILSSVMNWMGIGDRNTFAAVLVSALLLFILIKSVLTILIKLFQNRYLMSLYSYFSSNLFSDLFSKGLLFMRSSNISELTFNVNAACFNFAVGYLGNLLKFCGDVIFCVFLLTLLSVYDIRALVSIVVAFIPVTAIHILFVRKRLKKYGKQEFQIRREQNKMVLETFRGYSDMKINDAFRAMHDRFDGGLDKISDYRVKSNLIQAIPSRLYELAIAVVLAVMVFLHLNAGDPAERLFLGIFAVAIVRMLPVVMSLVSTWGSIKTAEYTIGVLDDLRNIALNNQGQTPSVHYEPWNFRDSVKVEDLTFSFPDRELFSGLSFEIKRGEKFGIRGRSGAGKSTIFNILLGLIPPDSGKILIDGVPLQGDMIGRWQAAVGYVSQDVFISDTTIAENIALGCGSGEIDRRRMNDAVDRACLREFVDSLPDGVDTRIGDAGSRISGGQRQRIGIARALYKGAGVLFFDEATSSLDVGTEMEIIREISELVRNDDELTIVIISHRPGSLEICDRILDI